MKRTLRKRFWLESLLAVAGGALAILTLVWRDWIEVFFGIDPDDHSGSLEWLIVVALLATSMISTIFALYEWRRVSDAAG
jgi:hypothetical protein